MKWILRAVKSLGHRIHNAWILLRDTAIEWDKDSAMQLAAGLAFYTVFSFAPMLILLVAGATSIFGEEAGSAEVISRLKSALSPSGVRMVQMVMQNAQPSSTTATVIGLAVVLFGATAVFVNLQEALNLIWGVKRRPGNILKLFFIKRFVSFLMLLAVGILLLASTVLSAFMSLAEKYLHNILPHIEILADAEIAVSILLGAVLFGTVYKVLPDVRIAWKDVWIGAFLSSVLFNIGRVLIGAYLAHSTFGSLYGAAGSFAVFLVWIYYSAQVFFFGAEFMQVYAKKRGVPIVPDKNAVAYRIETFEENL